MLPDVLDFFQFQGSTWWAQFSGGVVEGYKPQNKKRDVLPDWSIQITAISIKAEHESGWPTDLSFSTGQVSTDLGKVTWIGGYLLQVLAKFI